MHEVGHQVLRGLCKYPVLHGRPQYEQRLSLYLPDRRWLRFKRNVEVFPLPELSVDLGGPERGWNKLAVFAETLYDLKGKVLCLDLDLIITGSLDDLFDYPGEVMIIKDWIKKDGTGNSSVYRFEVGAHPEVLAEFEKSFRANQKDPSQ